METFPQIHVSGDPELEMEDQVLVYFQETQADPREMGGSRLPSVFYVSQKEPTDDRWLRAGSILRRWKVDKSDIIKIPENEPLPELVIGVLGYYDHGASSFSILSDLPLVRVGWKVGPG